MATIETILQALDRRFPLELAESWDHCGLVCGRPAKPVRRILTALDVTPELLRRARKERAQLLVSHHPCWFADPMSLTPEAARLMGELIRSDIGVICLHTCLDRAPGGLNDRLAAILGLSEVEQKGDYLRVGRAEECSAVQFAAAAKEALNAECARLYDAGKPVRRVGLVSGSGGDFLREARDAGADLYVTGDVKHHVFLEAADLGISLVDLGHRATEEASAELLRETLAADFPELDVTACSSRMLTVL